MSVVRTASVLVICAAAAAGGWYYYSNILAPPTETPAAAPAAGNAAAARPAARPARSQQVIVTTVKSEPMSDRMEAIGTLQANESITVTARASGIVRAIHFEDGQTVTQGSEIAAIDAGAEDAQLDVQLANLDEQRKTLERVKSLVTNNAASEARLDELTAAVKRAEANVAAARARVRDYRIIAPFSGVLGTRRVSLGALVSPGDVVTTLDDISVVKLDFSIPENFIASLRPGLAIEATSVAYAGEVFKGQVIAVDTRIDPATRAVAVRATLPNPDLRLRPGMLMVVDLIVNQRQAIVVPEQAVVPQEDSHYVFIIDGDSVAQRVQVTLGQRRMGSVEVLEGLNVGDTIVTEGAELRPGTKVEIANPGGATQLQPPTASRAARQPG